MVITTVELSLKFGRRYRRYVLDLYLFGCAEPSIRNPTRSSKPCAVTIWITRDYLSAAGRPGYEPSLGSDIVRAVFELSRKNMK